MNNEVTIIEFENSSGNVFADLNIPNAAEELAKADLATEITRRLRAKGLTQHEVADLLGTAPSKISAITRGRLAPFTYDRLLYFPNILGCNIEIVVTPADEAALRGFTVTNINTPTAVK